MRDRENRFDLRRVYEERIDQLSSRMPLLARLGGDFECKVDVSREITEGLEQRHLGFRFENGKIVKFKWWAILTPQSSDLRPGFHYSTDMQLSEMNIVQAPGYLSLQNTNATGILESCDVIFSKHLTMLHVFTVGCGSTPETSHLDYLFEQSGESCVLHVNEFKRPDVVR